MQLNPPGQRFCIRTSLPDWQLTNTLLFLHMLSLLTLALAPGIAIACYIYFKDKYNREPIITLLITFLLGACSIIPAILIQRAAFPVLQRHFNFYAINFYVIYAFGIVALSEEGCKFLVLRWYAWTRKAFDEPMDGIVYSVMASMGFATVENVMYVTKGGFTTGIVRMFLSVPAHASFAILMGYYAGIAKFASRFKTATLMAGFLLAAFFHGTFDFFLFLQNNPNVTRYVSTGLLVAGAIASYSIALRMAFKSIRLHQQLSKDQFYNTL